MVVGDGSALTVNAEENSDLFWAVRGGGSNFGVVTEFVLKLHEQRRTIYSGMLIYPPPLADSAFRALKEWWDNGPSEKEAVHQLLTNGPPPDFSVRGLWNEISESSLIRHI